MLAINLLKLYQKSKGQMIQRKKLNKYDHINFFNKNLSFQEN